MVHQTWLSMYAFWVDSKRFIQISLDADFWQSIILWSSPSICNIIANSFVIMPLKMIMFRIYFYITNYCEVHFFIYTIQKLDWIQICLFRFLYICCVISRIIASFNFNCLNMLKTNWRIVSYLTIEHNVHSENWSTIV